MPCNSLHSCLHVYFLTVIGYLKKKHHEALCLSFIDNSNNYIKALEIARAATTNRQRFSLSISRVCPQCTSNFSRLLKLQYWITHFYGQNASKNSEGNRMRCHGRSTWSKLPTTWEFFILSFKLMHSCKGLPCQALWHIRVRPQRKKTFNLRSYPYL